MQTAPSDYPTIRPHRIGIGFYDLDRGSLVRTHAIEIDIDGDLTDDPRPGRRPPPRTRAAERRRSRVREDPPRRAEPRDRDRRTSRRSRIRSPARWSGAPHGIMTRDGEMATRDYLDLVLAGIGTETESTTIRTDPRAGAPRRELLRAPASTRESAQRAEVADGLWNLLLRSRCRKRPAAAARERLAAAASTPAQWETVKTLKRPFGRHSGPRRSTRISSGSC